MKFEFKYNINEEEKQNLIAWYNSAKWISIEQHPVWWASTEPEKKLCFFTATKDDKIVCSAIITESRKMMLKYAEIQFGPIFHDNEILISSIQYIDTHYRKAGFTFLTVQLSFPTGMAADYIEYKINKTIPVTYFFDRHNWSSTAIDLSQTEEQLFKNLSKGHKSDIKKALKAELNVIDGCAEDDLSSFTEIYVRMHRERNLPVNELESAAYLTNVQKFFKHYGAGKFLLVTDAEKKVIGGIVLVFQNNTVRYFKGAADPSMRHLPVLHLAIWEAIKSSKAKGFESFDLWGYNHYVDESDQVFFINRFKKGFGGSFTFYPKKMYFIFKPIRYKLLQSIKFVYKRYLKK